MAGNAKGKSPSSALAYATTLQYVVEVSFNSDQPPAFPWNDLNGGTSIKQMVTTDGLNSFANLSLVKNFTGTNTLGATTYSKDNITLQYWWKYDTFKSENINEKYGEKHNLGGHDWHKFKLHKKFEGCSFRRISQ